MKIQVCRFKRRKSDDWEWGILIGENHLIVDERLNPVTIVVWDFERCPDLGCITFRLP
jgi:hypothetical protein